VTQNPPRSGRPLSHVDTVDRLGADLRAAGYDSDGVPALLGVGAHRALGRGELAPALRATRDRSPLATLTRLFLLGAAEDESVVSRALPRTGIADAIEQGVLERSGGAIRAALDIRPYSADAREFLLVSDLDSDTRPGPVRPDHVLGIGAASVTLARAVIREPVDRALDVGTGSGVQALHLASHAREVVATDVNPRALALAAATARLNGQHWDLRAGSMYEPVADEDFDLIVCNPPFVIGDGELRYSYRDSGLAGDGICQALIEGVRTHLRPGGTAQLLANWIVRAGTDWRDRVGGWVDATGCDAWVVQRELADPAQYVGLWLTDAGEDGKATGADPAAAAALAEHWLDYLAAERVQGIGMGLITLRRTDSARPSVTFDEITGPDEDVTGEEGAGFLRRRSWVELAADTDLLASRLVLSPQVILERRSLAGDDGWTTVLRMIRRPGGPGATLELDDWGQALLAGCRGEAPLRLLIELLAAAHGVDTGALAVAVLPAVRAAVIRGLLEPVTG
jgi:methylase of polypeptide subunit release factors